MPLFGLSAASWKYAKTLLRVAGEAVPLGLAWLEDELAANAEAPDTLEWRRFVLRWSRATPAGTVEDYAQFKLDIVNVTDDELDTTWTTADNYVVRDAFAAWRTAMLASVSSSQTFAELRAYRMRFNPTPDLTRPFAETGPPTYVQTIAQAGTQTGTLPYQVAPTCTFRTAWAKHWGRIYVPTPGTAAVDSNGRLTSTYRTALQGATATMVSSLVDAGMYPVVPVGQLDKVPFHALLGITTVVVDDVPDVQRRRRPRRVAART